MGYVLTDISSGTPEGGQDDVEASEGYCLRDGRRIELEPGMPVLAGDAILTERETSVALAFVDGSIVTLRPSTKLRVAEYSYPARKTPTKLALEEGRAFFAAAERPEGADFVVMAASASLSGSGARFQLDMLKDESGGWTASIAVTKNSVTLVRDGTNTNIYVSTLLTLTVRNAGIAGVDMSGGPVTLTRGNLSKDEMERLEADAAIHAEVNVGKKDDVVIRCRVKNWDGSITKIYLKERGGERVQISTVTKATDGTPLIRYDEKTTKWTRKITYVTGDTKTKVRIKGTTGEVSIKDGMNKRHYKGTAYLQKDGSWLADAVARDGTRIVQHVVAHWDGAKVDTTTIFQAGATEGIRVRTTTRADGSYERIEERVTIQRDANGEFIRAPGSTPTITTRGPSPDQPPYLRTPSTLLMPEPPPVSR
ncbi:MAG: FecR domain-containing protein [Planctomycetota bacterium]|nr:FecR domain-containing protein [Planctomycetota bacterium]